MFRLYLRGIGNGMKFVSRCITELPQFHVNICLKKCSDAIGANILMEMISPEIEFAYGWNRFHLRLIGLWPDQTRNNSKANFLIRYSSIMWAILVLASVIFPQILAPFYHSFVLDELIQIFATVVGIVGAVVKMIVLRLNGEASCLKFLMDDWTRKMATEERRTMMKNAKFGRNISIGFGILMHCLVWSYISLKVLPLINLRLGAENNTDLSKFLLYPAIFPFDVRKSSNFALVWIAQLFATFSSTIAYTASDCFIAMLVIHLCGQITILRQSLINLLDNEKSHDPALFHENLVGIVKRHGTLIRLGEVIEDTINLMLLILILIYTVQFGLQLFGLMTAVSSREPGQFPFLQVLFSISYLNVTIVHLYLYCYIGDMLIAESEAFGFASYSCQWYTLSGREAKDLIIVMHRARFPLQISAGKFVAFSLELFGNVLKTSMSYFSVLLTMKEQMAHP